MSRSYLEILHDLRSRAGSAVTVGLSDATLERLLARHPSLGEAIREAALRREEWAREHEELFQMPETEVCRLVQQRLLNFYPETSINPYIPLAGKGPWIVTTHGAVLHDSGGYGMLGLGHAPDNVLAAMSQPFVMANVMTPSFSHKRLTDRLLREIGHTRGSCPFDRFVCLNSGSEAVTFAYRVTDIHARRMTDPGAPAAGRRVVKMAAVEGFHGRTEGPARLSHSTRKAYTTHLASYREANDVLFVPFNDITALRETFERLDRDNLFCEAFFVEPVMGEGIPGLALDRAFYDEARRLSRKHGALLMVDSIQAALRAQGCLSIVDYPGFEDCDPPDMESYSKALNAGQYPLSVLAISKQVADMYVTGLYGNTMTTNPRAMEVACAVLDNLTTAARMHIRARGKEFLEKFEVLRQEFPADINQVVGTGLMVCLVLNPDRYKVLGADGFETWLRKHGIEMIHGGDSGLRFTPSFDITSEEIDLIVETIRQGMKELKS